MAKKKAAKKAKRAPSPRCPTKFKAGQKGVCFTVEKVQRNSHRGYITVFHSRASGQVVGYSTVPGACKTTRDPFQASVQPSRTKAERKAAQCVQAMTRGK